MDDWFAITQIRNEIQHLACISLCTEGDVLKWWKSNYHRFNGGEEVKDAMREYYADNYKLDRVFNVISDLQEAGTVHKYLEDIDRHNVYAKITNYHLINIILNGITPGLRQAIAHYEDLRSDPSK